MQHQPAHCHNAAEDAHENVLPCHVQEGLGDATGMFQAMAMEEVLPVVVCIALEGSALLAALPLLGGGIPCCLVVD